VEKTSKEFKDARKQINRQIRANVIEAGTDQILPYAKREKIPPMVRPNLVVRATGASGYITVKGARRLDRILGLNQFGGRLGGIGAPNEWLKPSSGKALVIPGGYVRANVSTVRVHKGSHSIQGVVRKRFPQFTDHLNRLVMEAFDGLEHSP
jgi:hypothetical protein